jgi:NTE family protein
VPASASGLARTLPLALMLLAAQSCASFTVVDTVPLPPAKLEPVGSESISKAGYRLDALPEHESSPDLVVLLAMSGGGKRSAAFAYGALKGMRQVMIPTRDGPRSLLSSLDGISGISGGSFTAAYYGLHRDQTFGQYEQDFLYNDTNASIWGIYVLPWNWTWLVDPIVGTNDYMERVYNRTMFHDAKFRDLEALGRPLIAIGATDISFGTTFLFTQSIFDVICADLEEFPVARAVAASNGFPGLFSPVTLTSRRSYCDGRKPGWLTNLSPSERYDPRSRLGASAAAVSRYLDTEQTKYVHLADGGISDNLGMRALGSMMEQRAHAVDASVDNIRRILLISIDGQGAQDSSVARRRVVGGIFSIFSLVSGAQIDRYNFDTLILVNDQLQQLAQALRKTRCDRAKVMPDGSPCEDVSATLLHVALIDLPDSPEKERLAAIPTGLTVSREDADLLIAAGESAIVHSEKLRQFLSTYPPARPPASGSHAARAKAY